MGFERQPDAQRRAGMRQLRRQQLTALTGIFAIAALIGMALGTPAIAAQEATPGATTQGEVTTGPDDTEPADIATPSETDQASETPPVTDDEIGDTKEGEETASSPSPSSSPPAATPAVEAIPTASCEMGGTSLPEVRVSGTSFGASAFDGTSYMPVTTTIAVTLTLPASGTCLTPNWRIAIAASTMRSEEDGPKPAGVITYHDVSGLTAPDLTAAELAPDTSLTTAQTIVIGTNQTLTEDHPTVTFAVTLTWSPPADATAGQYISRVTVECLAGENT